MCCQVLIMCQGLIMAQTAGVRASSWDRGKSRWGGRGNSYGERRKDGAVGNGLGCGLGKKRVWEKGREWQKVEGREGRESDMVMGTGERQEYGCGKKERERWHSGK